MSEIIKEFEDCLNSDLSCDEIYDKMKAVSKYKINKSLSEESIFNLAIGIFIKKFYNELLSISFNNSSGQIGLSHDNLFEVCHNIVMNKEKYEGNEFYDIIVSFYQTFYFFEINKENKSNDFTFYTRLFDGSTISKDVEIYLFNIGEIILNKNKDNKYIEILFSDDTPLFLKEIILICFEYIRFKKRKASDFIKLCIPCLNHYNLYYLNEILNRDCHYQTPYLGYFSYINFENFIKELKRNNSIGINEEPIQNFINIINDENENENEIVLIDNVDEAETEKYFNFTQEEGNENFFTNENIKSNKDKFMQMLNSKESSKYKVIYDESKIEDTSVNAFSFSYLLKHSIFNKIDKHFFQIFNSGNIKIELFSDITLKYLNLINDYLSGILTKEQKKELFENSGFYKYNNEYLLLMFIKEEDPKLFYLKNGLINGKITTFNNNNDYKVYQVIQSDNSSSIITTKNIYHYDENNDEEVLYNFGNYSFESEIRYYIKNCIKDNKDIKELPRLYVLLNYCIPVDKNQFQFITNVKSEIYNKSYGYGEIDFVLKNDSNNDIIIENEDLPYKEKIFMTFPKIDNKMSDQKIILKKNSIIFFEMKSNFPQFKWKDNFTHLFKKISKFIEIYKKRGVFNNEYIQIYFIYDNIPQLYYEKGMRRYINSNFNDLFENFEFGLYYFSRGINIINNQMLENKITDLDGKVNKLFELLEKVDNVEIKEELNKIKQKK